MKSLLALLAVSVLALFGAGAASAVETGTPAWVTTSVTIFEGPGAAYDVVGEATGGTRVYVERCSKLWCRIRADGGRGWVTQQYVAFGQEPRGPFTGPELNYKAGGPGTVCLYEGANYSGASICGETGFVIRDLLLFRADNAFSSVSIEGNVSVTLCRDRNFQNYCERVNESQPRLQGFLDNGVSSLRIY